MLHRALAVAGAVGAFVTIVTLLHHAPPRSTRLRTAEERAIVYRDGERRAAASRTSLAAALAASANRPTRELVRQGASFNAVDTSCHTEQGELDDACVARDGGWTCVQLCWPSTMQRIAAVRLNVRLGCRCTELDCIRYQGSALIGGYRSHAFTCTFRMDERKPSPPSPRSPPPSEPPLPPSAPMPPDSGADHSPTPLGIMATTRVADTPAQEDQTAPNDLNCDGAVRLTTYPEGNLQLRRDGKWGSVCAVFFFFYDIRLVALGRTGPIYISIRNTYIERDVYVYVYVYPLPSLHADSPPTPRSSIFGILTKEQTSPAAPSATLQALKACVYKMRAEIRNFAECPWHLRVQSAPGRNPGWHSVERWVRHDGDAVATPSTRSCAARACVFYR
mmetsp:Transcript_38799/g.96174  ORF Transcript_38799/g.96174 Transcript_38799/m.96174 type:complete len:391 (+) Transcript_38799:3-1175(+)